MSVDCFSLLLALKAYYTDACLDGVELMDSRLVRGSASQEGLGANPRSIAAAFLRAR